MKNIFVFSLVAFLIAPAVSFAVGDSTQSTDASPRPLCATISHRLVIGSSDAVAGGDVTRLQQALAQDSSIYPEGLITGYFGKATERAVQRLQAAQGIVASGNAATTGFGAIGPATRGIFQKGCGGSVPATPSSGAVSPSIILQTRTVSPTPPVVAPEIVTPSVSQSMPPIVVTPIPGVTVTPAQPSTPTPERAIVPILFLVPPPVNTPPQLVLTVNGSSGGASVFSGSTVIVAWATGNVSSCSVSSTPAGVLSSSETMSFGTASAALTANTVFTASCMGTNGASLSASATVTVTPAPSTPIGRPTGSWLTPY